MTSFQRSSCVLPFSCFVPDLTYLIHLPLFGGERPRQTVTGCHWLQRRYSRKGEKDPRAGARRGRRMPGGSWSSEHSWCHIDIFPIAKLLGDGHVDKHRVKHLECQLHPALFSSQDLGWVHRPELGATVPQLRNQILKKN